MCAALQVTCGHLRRLQASAAGQREMGLKVKLFELGAHAVCHTWLEPQTSSRSVTYSCEPCLGQALRPHFGVTNRRIFLHMAINLPTSGASYLRVGAG